MGLPTLFHIAANPFPAVVSLIDTLNCMDIDALDNGRLTYIITAAAPGLPGDGIFSVLPTPDGRGTLQLEGKLIYDKKYNRYRK